MFNQSHQWGLNKKHDLNKETEYSRTNNCPSKKQTKQSKNSSFSSQRRLLDRLFHPTNPSM